MYLVETKNVRALFAANFAALANKHYTEELGGDRRVRFITHLTCASLTFTHRLFDGEEVAARLEDDAAREAGIIDSRSDKEKSSSSDHVIEEIKI